MPQIFAVDTPLSDLIIAIVALPPVSGTSLVFDVDFTSLTPTEVTGSYEGTLETDLPFGPTFEALLATIDPSNPLFSDSLSIPPESIGRYSVSLAVDFDNGLTAVPLPASLPLLGAGMIVLAYLGRRRRT